MPCLIGKRQGHHSIFRIIEVEATNSGQLNRAGKYFSEEFRQV